jgi:hypothetical protein
MSTSNILQLNLSSAEKIVVSKIYRGKKEDIANTAVELAKTLKIWIMKRPDYNYHMRVGRNDIYLTVIKKIV